MTDFTRGPWVNDNGLVNGLHPDGITPSFDIYDADNWPGDDVEAHANANLIAAAPNLYAALLMARHMEHVQSRSWEAEFIDVALARAEGTEHIQKREYNEEFDFSRRNPNEDRLGGQKHSTMGKK